MVKDGYKETEIGIIPEDWEVKKIEDIAIPKARIGWQNLRKEEYLTDGDYLLITGTDFSDGKVILGKCCYVSKERYAQDKNIQISNGAILITKDGTLGKVAIVESLDKPATLNAGVFVLNSLEDNVDNRFLYQYLRTDALLEYAFKTSTGGTIKHLNQNVLVNFRVPCPPKIEQQKIAEALSDMDNLISSLEKLIEKKKAIKQACLQKMFPRDGETVPEMRLPGFTEAWEQRKLGELSESFEYGLNAAATEYDGKNKYIRITDIDDDSREFKQDDVTSPAIELSNADNYKLSYGDILFARTGASVGKSYIYKDSDGLVYYAGFLIRAKIKKDYNPEFVFQNTLTNDYEKFIKVTSMRSGQPGVNVQEYSQYQIMMPCKAEQDKISDYLGSFDHLITLHQRKLEKCRKIKEGMMQQLLTGKIRLI